MGEKVYEEFNSEKHVISDTTFVHVSKNNWIISAAAMCANWHYYRNREG